MSFALLIRPSIVLDTLTAITHHLYLDPRLLPRPITSTISRRSHSYTSICPSPGGPTQGYVRPGSRDVYTYRAAREWMDDISIGRPAELRAVKLGIPPHLKAAGLVVKVAKRPVLRQTDMQLYFGQAEHPMSRYRMMKYERKMATDSLFLYVYVGVSARAVVRSYVARWIRDAVWGALREKGWANTGRVLPEREGGLPEGRAPKGDVVGTLQIMVTNPPGVVGLKERQSLDLGRAIVEQVVEKQLVGLQASQLLKAVEFPADFLPHWKKMGLLREIQGEWEKEVEGRVEAVDGKLAEAIREKNKFFVDHVKKRLRKKGEEVVDEDDEQALAERLNKGWLSRFPEGEKPVRSPRLVKKKKKGKTSYII